MTNVHIEYENGAVVGTSFVTNLEPGTALMSCPELYTAIRKALKEIRKDKKHQPKYMYPRQTLMANEVNYFSSHGVSFRLDRKSVSFVRTLDSQRSRKKSMYGAGFLISEKAADMKEQAKKEADAYAPEIEKEEVTEWTLSERELEIVRGLE